MSRVCSFLIGLGCFAILFNKAIYSLIVSCFRTFINGAVIGIALSTLSCVNRSLIMHLFTLFWIPITCGLSSRLGIRRKGVVNSLLAVIKNNFRSVSRFRSVLTGLRFLVILFNKAIYSLITFCLWTFINGAVIRITPSSLCCINGSLIIRLSTLFRIPRVSGLVSGFSFRIWDVANSCFTHILNAIRIITIGYSFLWICTRRP